MKLTKYERAKQRAERLKWVAPDPDPDVERALINLDLATKQYSVYRTDENLDQVQQAYRELENIFTMKQLAKTET